MQVFVEVVDCGSFTKAAHATGLSQATVSAHVAELERRIGVRLLTRTTRSIALTDEGTKYYALCQRVLSEIDDTESLLAGARSTPRGRLRVDVTVALACRLIVPILPAFFARYPDITVELHHTGHLFDEEHETFDVIFRVGEMKESDLIARPISPMRLVIAASPDYLAKRGTPETPEDLQSHDCIGYINPITRRPIEWTFERDGKTITLPLRGPIACNEGESRIAAAMAGLGFVSTHAYELREAIQAGTLKIVLPDWTMPTRFFIAYPRDRYLSARVRAFVDFVIAAYPPDRMLDLT